MEKLKFVQLLSGHTDRVWDLAWNFDGSLLASCGGDKTIRIWSLEKNKNWHCQCILSDSHHRTVRSLAWSPCGRYLAAGSFDATISVWRKQIDEESRKLDFELITTLEGHSNEVKCVSWSPSGQYLATCSRDKTVWIWEFDDDEDFQCLSVLQPHSQDVKCVLWHPTQEILVSSSYDDTINIYKESLDDWAVVNKLEDHKDTVWCVAFNKDGSKMASCSDDLTVKIWTQPGEDPTQWSCMTTLGGYHTRTIYDCSWCPLTGLLVSASGDNSINIYLLQSASSGDNPIATQHLVRQVEAHSEDVNCARWNPKTPGLLATGSDDNMIKLWQLDMTSDVLNSSLL